MQKLFREEVMHWVEICLSKFECAVTKMLKVWSVALNTEDRRRVKLSAAREQYLKVMSVRNRNKSSPWMRSCEGISTPLGGLWILLPLSRALQHRASSAAVFQDQLVSVTRLRLAASCPLRFSNFPHECQPALPPSARLPSSGIAS